MPETWLDWPAPWASLLLLISLGGSGLWVVEVLPRREEPRATGGLEVGLAMAWGFGVTPSLAFFGHLLGLWAMGLWSMVVAGLAQTATAG